MKNAILWKRILNEGIATGGDSDQSENFANEIVTSPIIVASLEENFEQELSSVALPFRRFWVEGIADEHAWGCLVESLRTDSGWDALIHVCLGLKWMRPTVIGVHEGKFDDAGTMVPNSFFQRTCKAVAEPKEEISIEIANGLARVLMVLTQMTCKNVSLEPRDNDPKQVRKAIKRHGGNADKYRYHVLVVKPPGARSDAKGVEIGIMPRHVCRGHFSEYGPEFGKGLLFGRYAGRFYIAPHLKGDKKNGEVAKDYAIAPAGVQ